MFPHPGPEPLSSLRPLAVGHLVCSGSTAPVVRVRVFVNEERCSGHRHLALSSMVRVLAFPRGVVLEEFLVYWELGQDV